MLAVSIGGETDDDKYPRSWRALACCLLRAPAEPLARTFTIIGSAQEILRAADPASKIIQVPPGSAFAKAAAAPEFLTAMHIANPSLAACLNECIRSARWRRGLFLSILRYLVRASSRPTPFGLFSGVSLVPISDGSLAGEPLPRLRSPHISSARPALDYAWLMSAERMRVASLKDHEPLEMVANSLIVRMPGRIVLGTADIWGEGTNADGASADIGSIGEYLVEHARSPLSRRQLCEQAAGEFSQIPAAEIAAIIDTLSSKGFLIPGHRPQPARPYLGAQAIGERMPVPSDVAEAVTRLTQARWQDWHTGPLPQLVQVQQRYARDTIGGTVQVDASLDVGVGVFPQAIAELAEQIAAVAEVIGSAEPYPAALRQHALHFEDRYGKGAEVLLIEVVSDVAGIGSPEGYSVPGRTWPLPGIVPGAEAKQALVFGRLAGLIARGSANSGVVQLNAKELEQLFTPVHDSRVSPVALDVTFSIGHQHDGNLYAILSRRPAVPGGRMFARFIPVLGEKAVAHLRQVIAAEAGAWPDAVCAEVTFMPAGARVINVAEHPLLRDLEMAVNVTPSASRNRRLELDDLLVGVDELGYYLRSRRLGSHVMAYHTSMVAPLEAPDPVRFALDITAARLKPVKGFDWGILEQTVPALPRIVCGNLVLSVARWPIGAAPEFSAGPPAHLDEFRERLKTWRARWRVPEKVMLSRGDTRLVMDLSNEACIEDLFRSWRKNRNVAPLLCELLPREDECLLRNTAGEAVCSEVVVSVVRQPQAEGRSSVAGPDDVPQPRPVEWPGTGGLSLKLYAPSALHNDLIANAMKYLDEALDAEFTSARIYFTRSVDKAPHLHLVVRAATDEADDVMSAVLQWAASLGNRQLILDVAVSAYRPEYERYGGLKAFATAERLFCADSRAIIEWFASDRKPSADSLIVAAADFYDRLARVWGWSSADSWDLACDRAGPCAGGPEFRRVGNELWQLRQRRAPSVTVGPAGAELEVLQLAGRLAHLGELSSRPVARGVLLNVMRAHSNRMGVLPAAEPIVFGVWRRLLERAQAMSDDIPPI